jgi:hypothetical protein
MIHCGCFSHNTETDPKESVVLIGAGAGIRGPVIRAKPGRRAFVEAGLDPIAERRARSRRGVLPHRRIHLRHHRRLDFGRWRCWRHGRIKLRPAPRNRLRECGVRSHQRCYDQANKNEGPFHRGYVVTPSGNGKSIILQARSRSDRTCRPRGRAGSTIATYAAAVGR